MGGPVGVRSARPSGWYAVIVLGTTVLAVLAPGGGPPGGPDGDRPWLTPVAALLVGVALVLLRHRPAAAVGVALVGCSVVQLVRGGPTGLLVLLLLALLLAGLRLPLRPVLLLLAVSCLTYLVVDVATGGFDSRVLAPLALMAACTAAGVAVSGQQALLRAATDRAAAAEQNRRDEAARLVAEERLRIARELHDVVAHHVAVMGVQAGAAEQLLDSDHAQVRTALAQVRASGRTALAELGAVVGLLRTRSDAVDDDALRPVAAGIEALPGLVDTVRAAGLRLTVEPAAVPSAAPGLDEVAGIAAYRIVQESLTNAMKHGTGEARLTVQVESAGLSLLVTNPVPEHGTGGSGGSGSGHGLPGMRERADLVGAALTAGRTPDGCFQVRVRIPYRRP